MKKIYTSEDRFLAQSAFDALEAAGYRCLMRNLFAGGGAGEIPPQECWPEVWLINEAEYDEALRFLHETFEVSPQGDVWQCGKCGERNEPSFEICWKCGTDRKAASNDTPLT